MNEWAEHEYSPISDKDREIETKFVPPPEVNKKLHKILETMIFKTLDIKQQKSCYDCPSLLSKESFQTIAQKSRTTQNLTVFLNWRIRIGVQKN